MTAWRYILASLRQYRRVHVAVAAGVAVATAVITGALLVGDSMRGSLRELALRGLGRVDSVLVAEHPFRTALADEWLAASPVKSHIEEASPLIITTGVATSRGDDGEVRRATGLSVYGVTPEFWSLAPPDPLDAERPPSRRWPQVAVRRGNEIALTGAVAFELGVREGDFVVLRLPLAGATPADSALGEKEEASASRRLRVATVLRASDVDNMARFGLRPSQVAPRNAFVPLETLQALLELPDQANALALATTTPEEPLAADALAAVRKSLRPELSDFGITVEAVEREAPAPGYLRISADRLVLPPHVVNVAEKLADGGAPQPVVTYLANTIAAGDRKIPYSTVVGGDSTRGLGPVVDESGNPISLADDEIALNDWAADDLGVAVGDKITIRYYEPETTHGVLREGPPLVLTLRTIVPLADAEARPTAAADPEFAPELPGVTDQESIDSWELPFELIEEVRQKDEDYWDERRTTPKAFVSYALAARLWGTRWGTVSVLRIPLPRGERLGEGRSEDGANSSDDTTSGDANPSPSPSLRGRGTSAASLQDALAENLDPAEMGMSVLPVKHQALQAASGTTPFDGLFLGFSFFLMASAVLLTALLFRLGVEQRAREVGLLAATGASPRRVRQLLSAEAAIVAAGGAIVGAAAGIVYAAIMVYGLNHWWVDATSAPFLELHLTPRSLAIGLAAGLLVALATIWQTLRTFARVSPRQLLAGEIASAVGRPATKVSRFTKTILPATCLLAAAALGVIATRFEGEAQAGAFFGGGALALIGVLAAVRGKLREPAAKSPSSLSLGGLALRNVRRNPSRTLLSLALAAMASFLIVALSAFRLEPTSRGTGGFDLLASADVPLHYDLDTPDGRRQLGFSDADSAKLANADILSFRVRDGEDASCLNLYQATQPRVLGAPQELAAQSNFQWAMADAARANSGSLPSEGEGAGTNMNWQLLTENLGDDADGRPIVPVVLDRNTAFYSLKLYKLGDRLTLRDALDRPVTLQIVGMLANSILQGDVVVSELNFVRLFPEVAGRRYFLIHRSAESPPTAELASLLETQLEDFGFDAVDARDRLAELMAVQNTYLSTFQTLGGLGLLLGAVGLAVVQLRSVLERRGELALMQASGFRRRRLVTMVLAENLAILLGGLAIGSLAALAAVLPHSLIQHVGVPWRTLAALLAIVAIAGAAAAWLAARSALRAPLIPALRGE